MKAKTPEGELNQRWSQKRNGTKFIVAGMREQINSILSADETVIVAAERARLLAVRSHLTSIILEFRSRNYISKEKFLDAQTKRT